MTNILTMPMIGVDFYRLSRWPEGAGRCPVIRQGRRGLPGLPPAALALIIAAIMIIFFTDNRAR